jgi:hypothetical protein
VLHSIETGKEGSLPSVSLERVLDDKCGPAYSAVLGDLIGAGSSTAVPPATIIDTGSTATFSEAGDACSHVLVTSHECTYDDDFGEVDAVPNKGLDANPDGGQLFSYKIPKDWRRDKWERSTVAGGFKCKSNLNINPGAPGFPYLFYPDLSQRALGGSPHIALSGDGSESAYIFRPDGDSGRYSLMCEIDCGATVGSLAISYKKFCREGEEGYAKLFIAAYERDKVFVLGFGPFDVGN